MLTSIILRAMQSRAHRSDRYAFDLCDLLVFHTFETDQQQRRSPVAGQPPGKRHRLD
jgi:hypothetical protein